MRFLCGMVWLFPPLQSHFNIKMTALQRALYPEKDACSAIRFLGFDGREIRKRVYALRFGFEAPGGGAMRLCIRDRPNSAIKRTRSGLVVRYSAPGGSVVRGCGMKSVSA